MLLTGFLLCSCNEASDKSGLATATVSNNSPINFVSLYKEGNTLDFLYRSEKGNYIVDENVKNSLAALEKAALDFYLVAYDMPFSGDLNKVPGSLEAERWPTLTFENAFNYIGQNYCFAVFVSG